MATKLSRIRQQVRYQRAENILMIDADIARIQARLLNSGLDWDDINDLMDRSREEASCTEDRLRFWQRIEDQMAAEDDDAPDPLARCGICHRVECSHF